MFGYIQPHRDELKIREFELYKSVYCGLCKHLGKDYGIVTRLTLSYDCTVLAMLYMALNNDSPCVGSGRCVCNPAKKCLFCDCNNEAFRFAGAVSVIMTYYKLQDTIQDGGFFKKIGGHFGRLGFRRSYKKARKAYQNIDRQVSEMMAAQSQAEANNSGVDASAEPTAKLISSLCTEMTADDSMKRVLGVFGYHIGRWIYLMDAADDLEKDLKHHNFNPFGAKYNGEMAETMTYCNDVLNMTAAQIVMSYDLLNLRYFKEVLDNIVYNGLSFQQRKYLFEKYKKEPKKKKDYYSDLSNH